jgi:hypothetical protein
MPFVPAELCEIGAQQHGQGKVSRVVESRKILQKSGVVRQGNEPPRLPLLCDFRLEGQMLLFRIQSLLPAPRLLHFLNK